MRLRRKERESHAHLTMRYLNSHLYLPRCRIIDTAVSMIEIVSRAHKLDHHIARFRVGACAWILSTSHSNAEAPLLPSATWAQKQVHAKLLPCAVAGLSIDTQ